MAEHTPTTGEIRYRVEHDWEPYGDGSFDRWLAEHDAELRAEVERLREDLDFERGQCARLAGLADKAERQVADLREGIAVRADAATSILNRVERVRGASDWLSSLRQAIDALHALAGSGEQPGDRPAPVVPDSAGLRGVIASAAPFADLDALDRAVVRPIGQEGS